ncbi:MAG: hypothetical protein J6Z80_04715, partial [Clostridia bacterium]|nr:hypothetical protein [Clostridia bacterium]
MKTERKIKKICDEMDMPERSAVYPPGVSAKAPKRVRSGRLAIELAASGVLLFVMVFAIVIGPGLIRKDYVEPGVTGENSGTADDTMVIDVPKQGDDSSVHSIIYESGGAFDDFTFAPRSARAGDTVEIRTNTLSLGISVYVDGQEISQTYHGGDYWGYTFVMPDKDVTVTSRRLTISDVCGIGPYINPSPAYESKVAYANWTDSEKLLSCL